MCFGSMQTTQQQNSTSTSTPPAWLTQAAQSNLGFAQNLQNTGFQPYTGQFVAPFSTQQQQSFGLGGGVAGGVAPYVGETGALINNYATAGPQSVSPNTISSAMSPYMNAYVGQALAPQLTAQDQQFAQQNKSFDSAATGAGAFGDTGWGLGRSNLTTQQNIARTGLVGQAYTNAFNTAIGAGAQDVANNLTGQTTNANLAETALGRQLTGANALYSEGTGATNLLNTLGGQQTAAGQADLNARYNQYLMGQQYPFQTAQLYNQTIGAARAGAPTTTTGSSTTQAPNNAGYGILGSLIGAAGTALGGPIGGMIGSGIGSMFSGGGSSPAGNGMNYAGTTGGLYGPGYADGGTPPVGVPSLVGERGPELFVPTQPGVVIPNEALRAAAKKMPAPMGRRSPNASVPQIQFGLAA